MELSSFSENIVALSIERNGETVELQINIDAIVPDYYEQLEVLLEPITKRYEDLRAKCEAMQVEIKKRQKGKSKSVGKLPSLLSIEKEVEEIRRETFAEKLTCPVKLPDGSFTALLKGWDITENGMVIAVSKENLLRMPPKAVEELWERSIKRATTVKKRVDEEDEETLENSPSGTRALHAVNAQTG